jgi:3-oxoacyl-[acyl-carrier-protein] synthase III
VARIMVDNINLAGVSAIVPANIESNHDLLLSDEEKKTLIKTTGIETRRIADPTITAADLCIRSAQKLMSELKWLPNEIEIIVFVSQTPDHTIPGSSMFIQHRLGLSKQCMSIDINQGCAGYVYGLSVISSLMQSGQLKKGLLLVGDTLSKVIKKGDTSLTPVFSDAGSCTALEIGNGSMDFHLQTDGSGFEQIIVKNGGARKPNGDRGYLYMNGQDVFNFALQEVVPNVQMLLSSANVSIDEVDYLVMHQANILLNEAIRKKLNVNEGKTLYSLREYGNTSCATIPVSISSNTEKLSGKKDILFLLVGFGVGLSWGSALIKSNGTKFLTIDDYR